MVVPAFREPVCELHGRIDVRDIDVELEVLEEASVGEVGRPYVGSAFQDGVVGGVEDVGLAVQRRVGEDLHLDGTGL